MSSTSQGTSAADGGDPAGGTTIQAFRIGDYGLIHAGGAPPGREPLRRAVPWEWATSRAGVMLRLDATEAPDDEVVRGLVSDCSALLRAWPGTPIAIISRSRRVRDLVGEAAGTPRLLATGETLPAVWSDLWTRGAGTTFTVELPLTVQAQARARGIVAQACAQWGLGPLAGPAASLTDDLVARSVLQGAQDIHLTVSRHRARIRLLARDDEPSTAADEPMTIDVVFAAPDAAPPLALLAGSFGEFALDGHHVRWAVTHHAQAA